MNLSERIKSKLQESFTPVYLQLQDDSAAHKGHAGAKSGAHFSLTIVSDLFQHKNLLARHRMIYASVNDLMQKDIHAFAIHALTVEEFKAESQTDFLSH